MDKLLQKKDEESGKNMKSKRKLKGSKKDEN